MTLDSLTVTVANAATLIAECPADDDDVTVQVTVPSGGQTVEIGDSGVTFGTGTPVSAGAAVAIDLERGEKVYGIVSAGTQVVRVLKVDAD